MYYPERSRRVKMPVSSGVEKRAGLKVPAMNYFASMLYNTQQEAYYVYIILCSDDSYYTGLTDDLVRRFQEHIDGYYETCYTFKRRPLELKYYETIPFLKDAMERENR